MEIAILIFMTVVNMVLPIPSNGTDTIYIDPRDSQIYEIVSIGSNIWFKENLKYETLHSVCYDSLASNCEKYGRLYPYDEAKIACPEYWHLPNQAEIEELYRVMGTHKIHKMASPLEWGVKGANKFSNSIGLSVLPAGRVDSFSLYSPEEEKWIDTMAFHQKGFAASYWLNDIGNSEGVLHWHIGDPIGNTKSGMHRHSIGMDEHKFSIRCVCDSIQRK